MVQLVRELAVLGCRADVACPPTASRMRAEIADAGLRALPELGAPSDRRWLGAVARSIAADRRDVLHVHDGRAAAMGAALVRLARPARLVRTQHYVKPGSVLREGLRGRVSRHVQQQINRQVDGYIAVSRAVADAAQQRRETADAAIVVIPPGIDLPDPAVVECARAQRAGLPHPVVLFAGRLEPERRLDVLVRAVPSVLRELPHCRFMLAGGGSAEPALRTLAAELEVEGAISWPGWVASSANVLGAGHVYANPWPWEAFGMAMAEAMAHELPVVGVDSGASPELIEDGVTGELARPEDPESLAAAVVRVAADLRRAAEMGRRARQAAGAYGAHRTARETLAFYQRLCAAPSEPSRDV